jgi:serine/threonine-protein kinase RsbW
MPMLARAYDFMGNARDAHQRDNDRPRQGLTLVFAGDPHSVRRALRRAMTAFRAMSIPEEHSGVAEIVLAEVLNNIVEHAYADHGRGVVELSVRPIAGALSFTIRDDGLPLTDGTLPAGRLPDLSVPLDELPEGGFGWLMIHDLTRDLNYRRIGNRNELTFLLDLDPIEVAGKGTN